MDKFTQTLAGRTDFGKIRLEAFGDLTDNAALELQRKIAGDELLLRTEIQNPKTPAYIKERLSYYYKEVAGYYYQSKSTDIEHMADVIRLLQELQEDIVKDTELNKTLHRMPLMNIIDKTVANIEHTISIGARIGRTVKKVLGLPVGGLLAGAATRSPLIGLAVTALEMASSRGTRGKTTFHKEQQLNEKALERANLAKPAGDNSFTPLQPAETEALGGSSSSDGSTNPYEQADAELNAELNAHAASGAYTPPYTLKSEVGSNAAVAILSKHTNLLAGTYENTKILVDAATNKLDEEEAASEKSSSLIGPMTPTAAAVKPSGAGGIMGIIGGLFGKLQGFIAGVGPMLMGAIGGIIPLIAGALPGLAMAATATVGAGIGWLLGKAFNETEAGKKVGDFLTKIFGKFMSVDEDKNAGATERNNKIEAENVKKNNGKTFQQFMKENPGSSRAEYLKGTEGRAKTAAIATSGSAQTATISSPVSGEANVSTSVTSAPTASATSGSAQTDTISSPVSGEANVSTSVTSAPTASASSPSAIAVSVDTSKVRNVPGELPIDYNAYTAAIGNRESSNNYRAENTLGYIGKYQFGLGALEDVGLLKPGASKKGKIKDVTADPSNWTIAGGKEAFFNSPEIQEKAMVAYTKLKYKTLLQIKAIDKTTEPAKVAGMLAASHLLGPGAAVKDLNKKDAYGSSGKSYFALGSAAQAAAPTRTASISGNAGASIVADQSQSGRQDVTSNIANAPALAAGGGPVIVTNNQNNSVVGGFGGISKAPLLSPTDSSPTLRSLVGNR